MIKLINIGLVLAFSIGYLEWGGNNSSFIFQVEYTLFTKTTHLLETFTHPLIIFGFTGQLFLIISAIKKVPNKRINLIGLLLLGIIILLLLFVGILSINYKIITSVIPFIILSVLYFKYLRKKRQEI